MSFAHQLDRVNLVPAGDCIRRKREARTTDLVRGLLERTLEPGCGARWILRVIESLPDHVTCAIFAKQFHFDDRAWAIALADAQLGRIDRLVELDLQPFDAFVRRLGRP